jgi:hypothetical protein
MADYDWTWPSKVERDVIPVASSANIICTMRLWASRFY